MDSLDFQFGSFGIESPLETENEYLRSQLIEVDRLAYKEKSEIIASCSAQIIASRQKLEELQARVDSLEAENADLRRPVVKRQRPKHAPPPAKGHGDDKALLDAISEKLTLTERRWAEAQSTITSLQAEVEKMYALRSILIKEYADQYNAGVQNGYKAFAKRAYDFLGRFRSGMIDDLLAT